MSIKRKLVLAGTGLVSAAALVFGSTMPAFAGEWAWGSKNCIGTGSGYVYTHSGGSGDITHFHSGYPAMVFHNGTVNLQRDKTFWSGIISSASVAGASATWGSYNCSSS